MLSLELVLMGVLGVGFIVGSFLNVCIYRLPFEKSILWPPGSHCGHCYQRIRWYDNIPLLSYWLLRGRCRTCGAAFSMRYFFIELLTGLGFLGLFYLEVVRNIHGLEALLPLQELQRRRLPITSSHIPIEGWLLFVYHALLFCLLLVASVIDLDHLEIPMPITVTGTFIGLVGGALLWPWLPASTAPPGVLGIPTFRSGVYPWPIWTTLPSWLPPRSPLTGLATGLVGVAAGIVVLRAINFLFKVGRGREGIGMGDADLMMMVGSFLGWQPMVVAFFAAVFPGMIFGIMQLLLRGDRPFPFGPSLAVGSVLTWLGWRWIGSSPSLRLFFFDPLVLGMLAGAGAVFMLVASLVLRLVRGSAGGKHP
jgi:leader peptidase (prepilin peptidase)/N-methyltransferase